MNSLKQNSIQNSQQFGLEQRHIDIVNAILTPYAHKIKQVLVFGSRVWGRYKPYSDLDLAIDGDLDFKDLGRIKAEFIDSRLPIQVDLLLVHEITHKPLLEEVRKGVVWSLNT